MSSPHINNTLLLGCILIYSATFMSTAVSKSSILCKVSGKIYVSKLKSVSVLIIQYINLVKLEKKSSAIN